MASLFYIVMPFALVLLTWAALQDIVVRLIPNWLSVVIFGLGMVLRVVSGDWLWALGASALVFALCVLAWRWGLLGGGDVKLLAAVTPLVPPWDVPALIAAIALAGGLLAVLFILLRWLLPPPPVPNARPRQGLRRVWRVEARRIRRGGPLPYAVAIALGTAWIALGGGVMP